MANVITVEIISRKAETAIDRLKDLGFTQFEPDNDRWLVKLIEDWGPDREKLLLNSITSYARRAELGVDFSIEVEDEDAPLTKPVAPVRNRYTSSPTGTQPEDVNDGSAY
jgi:hypothetical protein